VVTSAKVVKPRARITLLILLAALVLPATASSVRRPDHGGLLRIGLSEPIVTADPAAARSFGDWLVIANVHRGLYQHTGDSVAPSLLAGPLRAKDGLYVGDIRADARFHDGTPVTAADVVGSFERLRHSPWRTASEELTVQATGSRGLAIRCSDSIERLAERLASPALVVHKRAGRIGAGPFRLRHLAAAGDSASLVVDKRHFAGRPPLDRIELTSQMQDSDLIESFHYGRLDVVFVDSPRYRKVKRLSGPVTETIGLLVFDRPASHDARVRQWVAANAPRRAVSLRTRGSSRESVALVPHREGADVSLPRPSGGTGTRWFLGAPRWLESELQSLSAGLGAAGTPWPAQIIDPVGYRRVLLQPEGRWDAIVASWLHVDTTARSALQTLATFASAGRIQQSADAARDLRTTWRWIPIVDRGRIAIFRPKLVRLSWTRSGTLDLVGAWIRR
jgi:hypothetical protein